MGVGLGWPHLSPYATLARHQPRDPQALCLNSYMDEQEALEACQEEVTAMSKRSIKKCDKQAMANRLVLLVVVVGGDVLLLSLFADTVPKHCSDSMNATTNLAGLHLVSGSSWPCQGIQQNVTSSSSNQLEGFEQPAGAALLLLMP